MEIILLLLTETNNFDKLFFKSPDDLQSLKIF